MSDDFQEMLRVKAGQHRKIKRSKKEKREITLGAIRSELRKHNQTLQDVTFKEVHETLEHIYYVDRGASVAAQWYINATDNQWKLLKQDINRAKRLASKQV
jgi:hypothetical protein